MKKNLLFVIIIVLWIIMGSRPSLLMAAPADYRQEKMAYQEALFVFRQARTDFLNAQKKWQAEKNPVFAKDALEKAKNFLLRADQTAIKYLQMLAKNAQTADGLADSQRQSAKEQIDKDLVFLTRKQSEIQSASTKKELVSLARETKSYWQKTRSEVKKMTGQALANKSQQVMAKVEEIGTRVKKALDKAKSGGRQTSQLETRFVSYQKNLETAKAKYKESQSKFAAIGNPSTVNQLFNEGVALIREGNQNLRQAHVNLSEVIRGLK